MTINEIEKQLQEIATTVHPRLIVTLETRPDRKFNWEDIFDNQITLYFKFRDADSLYTTILNYQLINKLRAEDELQVDMYFHRIVREGFLRLLWHRTTI